MIRFHVTSILTFCRDVTQCLQKYHISMVLLSFEKVSFLRYTQSACFNFMYKNIYIDTLQLPNKCFQDIFNKMPHNAVKAFSMIWLRKVPRAPIV